MEPKSQPAKCPNCHSDDPRVVPIVDSGGLCRDKWHNNWSPAPSEPGESVERNAVYKELRQIYCCKGAEFSRPTLEKAWKEIARLCAQLQEREREIEQLKASLAVETSIVDRVWKALGITTYEQAGGKAIDEIVAERDTRIQRLREALEKIEESTGDGIDCRVIAEAALKNDSK